MADFFNAQFSQEHCSNIRNLALSLGVHSENIVFKTEGCSFGSMEVSIKFGNKENLGEFLKSVEQLYPYLLRE